MGNSLKDKYISTDLLTGIGDKEAFTDRLSQLLASSEEDKLFSMIIIDIDHFKSINDGFGHRRGDQILSEFGARVISLCRENDFIYRYGGDEFIGLFPNADRRKAVAFAQRLLDKTRLTEFVGDPPLSITLSIGVAEFPQDGSLAKDIFDTADKRLYIAKRNGRDRIVSEESKDTFEMENYTGRLLGRERELNSFVSFTEEAAEKGRGFFLINGSEGSGKGFFLEAVSAHLELSNYKILTISALNEQLSSSSLEQALSSYGKSDSVIDSLYKFTGSSMSLAVILKDAHLIDTFSIENILNFYTIYPGWMIVVASTSRNLFSKIAEFGGVSFSVNLGSVSLEDCRAWFRANVMWNPPDELLEWFHKETGGLPGLFVQGLKQLRRRGYLTTKNGQFVVHEKCLDFLLGERLALGVTQEISNLPINLTPFQGRVEELSLLSEYIDSKVKLINITGERGSGRRRLAIKSAEQNEISFSSGVCYLDCSQETEPVSSVIASIFTLPAGNQSDSILESFLSTENVLFVLTNIDSHSEIKPFLQRFLQSCPQIKFIVTSSSSLKIANEVILPLSGLSTSKQVANMPSAAAKIFIQTAEIHAGERFVSEDDLQVIEQICLQVRGNPLALELAASWMRVMSVASIYRRIAANPSFLHGNDEVVLSENLTGIYRQSLKQLPISEKNAALRLTVFAGHFSLEEAEQIADVSPEMMISLLNSSLLVRDDMGIYLPGNTLDYLNQSGKDASESKGIQVAEEMHCRHFAAKVATIGSSISMGSDVNRGLSDIKASFRDISRSWKVAVEKGKPAIIEQILSPIFIYCLLSRSFQTGLNLLSDALSNSSKKLPIKLQAEMLAYQSYFAFKVGEFELYQELVGNSLQMVEEISGFESPLVYRIAGELSLFSGKLVIAGNYLSKALRLYPKEDISVEKLKVELLLLNCNFLAGDYQKVRTKLYSLSEKCQKISYRTGEFETKLFYGRLAALEGDFRRAKEIFLRYLSFVKVSGFYELSALVLQEIGKVEVGLGSEAEALDHLLSAVDYYNKVGSPSVLGLKTICLAEAQGLMKAAPETIENQFKEALSIGENSGNASIVIRSLINLALNRITLGSQKSSGDLLKKAIVLSKKLGNKPALIKALFALALADKLSGEFVRATLVTLSLLQNSAADFESEMLCVALIGELRLLLGPEHMELMKADTETINLDDLIELYQIDTSHFKE